MSEVYNMQYKVGTEVYMFSYGKSVVSTPNCEVLHLIPSVSRASILSTDLSIPTVGLHNWVLRQQIFHMKTYKLQFLLYTAYYKPQTYE